MSDLYERDFYGWAMTQADVAERRSAPELDWRNIAEELASLGRKEASELHDRFVVLLAHLLKWEFQPQLRTRSWVATIAEQRRQAARLLRRNPSLKAAEAEEFLDAYETACVRVAGETELPIRAFPAEAPFTLEQAKDDRFWPGPPAGDDLRI